MGWCWYEIKVGVKVKIDREDLARVSCHRWSVTYTTQGNPRVVTSISHAGQARKLTLGRFLLGETSGAVFRRNHEDPFDYRKASLAQGGPKELKRALGKMNGPYSSPYKGVSRERRGWRATIQKAGRSRNLGTFLCPAEAARAYDQAARQLFGDGCFQNFPQDPLTPSAATPPTENLEFGSGAIAPGDAALLQDGIINTAGLLGR